MTKQEEYFVVSALITSLLTAGLEHYSLESKAEKLLEEEGLTAEMFDDLESLLVKTMQKEHFGDIDMSAVTQEELEEGHQLINEQMNDFIVGIAVNSTKKLLESMEALK